MKIASTEDITPGAIYFFFVNTERARCRIVLNRFGVDAANVLVSSPARTGSPVEARTLDDIVNIIEWNPE